MTDTDTSRTLKQTRLVLIATGYVMVAICTIAAFASPWIFKPIFILQSVGFAYFTFHEILGSPRTRLMTDTPEPMTAEEARECAATILGADAKSDATLVDVAATLRAYADLLDRQPLPDSAGQIRENPVIENTTPPASDKREAVEGLLSDIEDALDAHKPPKSDAVSSPCVIVSGVEHLSELAAGLNRILAAVRGRAKPLMWERVDGVTKVAKTGIGKYKIISAEPDRHEWQAPCDFPYQTGVESSLEAAKEAAEQHWQAAYAEAGEAGE